MVSLVRRSQEPPRPMARRERYRPSRELSPLRESLFASPFFDWDWNPFGELESLLPAVRAFSPDIEVKETQDHYMFQVDLPGMKEDDVEISISGNRLTIRGAREQEEEREEGAQYHVYERSYGSFSRSFTLPPEADLDNVKAELKNGVLCVEVPKKATAATKQISINAGRETAPAGAAGATVPPGGTTIQEKQAEQPSAEEKKSQEKPAKAA